MQQEVQLTMTSKSLKNLIIRAKFAAQWPIGCALGHQIINGRAKAGVSRKTKARKGRKALRLTTEPKEPKFHRAD
jgi:hypothetical protein